MKTEKDSFFNLTAEVGKTEGVGILSDSRDSDADSISFGFHPWEPECFQGNYDLLHN
jgi:hypothetical protein